MRAGTPKKRGAPARSHAQRCADRVVLSDSTLLATLSTMPSTGQIPFPSAAPRSPRGSQRLLFGVDGRRAARQNACTSPTEGAGAKAPPATRTEQDPPSDPRVAMAGTSRRHHHLPGRATIQTLGATGADARHPRLSRGADPYTREPRSGSRRAAQGGIHEAVQVGAVCDRPAARPEPHPASPGSADRGQRPRAPPRREGTESAAHQRGGRTDRLQPGRADLVAGHGAPAALVRRHGPMLGRETLAVSVPTPNHRCRGPFTVGWYAQCPREMPVGMVAAQGRAVTYGPHAVRAGGDRPPRSSGTCGQNSEGELALRSYRGPTTLNRNRGTKIPGGGTAMCRTSTAGNCRSGDPGNRPLYLPCNRTNHARHPQPGAARIEKACGTRQINPACCRSSKSEGFWTGIDRSR